MRLQSNVRLQFPRTVDGRQSSRDLEVVENTWQGARVRARCTRLLPREDERESCYSR